MKFSIIIPTYKRAEKLIRSVESVLNQTHTDWEMIIVNDSPDDITYQTFASSINDPRIHYHINSTNRGVNFSRNYGLEKVSADSKWIIFLDDDDFFAKDTLETFYKLITSNQGAQWFVTNRTYTNGRVNTNFPKNNEYYSYAWSYLITKRCKGDATHCIETKLLRDIRFSKYIKQAEEWFFFYQVGLKSRMYYHNHNSTLSDGYDTSTGLNFRKRTTGEQLEKISTMLSEGATIGLIYHPTFIVYLFLRFIRIFIKHS